LGSNATQYFESHIILPEILNGVDEMPQIPAKAIKLSDNQGIAGLQSFQAGSQPWEVVFAP